MGNGEWGTGNGSRTMARRTVDHRASDSRIATSAEPTTITRIVASHRPSVHFSDIASSIASFGVIAERSLSHG